MLSAPKWLEAVVEYGNVYICFLSIVTNVVCTEDLGDQTTE